VAVSGAIGNEEVAKLIEHELTTRWYEVEKSFLPTQSKYQ
jgi:hypothetical protein